MSPAVSWNSWASLATPTASGDPTGPALLAQGSVRGWILVRALGVNYIYGTWAVLTGLRHSVKIFPKGISSVPCAGWSAARTLMVGGESCETYVNPQTGGGWHSTLANSLGRDGIDRERSGVFASGGVGHTVPC